MVLENTRDKQTRIISQSSQASSPGYIMTGSSCKYITVQGDCECACVCVCVVDLYNPTAQTCMEWWEELRD